MIKVFRDRRAVAIDEGHHPGKGFPGDLIRVTRRKLIVIAEARALDDLRAPPSNRLEASVGDRKDQHAIRINDQFRIRFVWTGADAESVEIVDYH